MMIDNIINIACDFYEEEIDNVCGLSEKKRYVFIRDVISYIACKIYEYKDSDVAKYFQGKSKSGTKERSSIASSVARMEDRIYLYPANKQQVETLIDIINQKLSENKQLKEQLDYKEFWPGYVADIATTLR